MREAARRFDFPLTSLHHRLNGRTNRAETRANNHKLTQNEEISLKQWILDMDSGGVAL